MDIKRFDEAEFRAIKCGATGGYYRDGSDEAERAVLLMNEGVFKQNPKNHWHVDGWKFTDYGEKYYDEFMRAVRQKHGHQWFTRRELEPGIYNDDDEYDNQTDTFAMSEGFHNGPKCKKCGYEFCEHCKAEIDIPPCTA